MILGWSSRSCSTRDHWSSAPRAAEERETLRDGTREVRDRHERDWTLLDESDTTRGTGRLGQRVEERRSWQYSGLQA
jgi:hypothetical protein